MKKIQFDTVNGTTEVIDFDTSIKFYGIFSDTMDDYAIVSIILNHHEDSVIGGMVVSDILFDKIDNEYGVTKL